MNNTFSSEQTSNTGNVDSSLFLRQKKLDFLARFVEIKPVNPKLEQNHIAKESENSSSSL